MAYLFDKRSPLGRKTYWLFLLKNSVGAIIFLGLMLVFLVLAFIGSSMEAIQAFLILGLMITAFLFVLLTLIAILWTWIEYRNYTFVLDEHALEVSRGVFTKENISIPYHHIEDINLEQSMFYQMLGVCKLVIMTAGHEDSHGGNGSHAEGILPAIDLQTGREIQKQIMHRSNFQEVIMKSKIVGPASTIS